MHVSSSGVPSPSLVLRLADGRFPPGISGNPGGRPRAARHVTELARQHTNLAIETLASIAADTNAPEYARIAASATLLDRGWGKPAQAEPAMVRYPSGMGDASQEDSGRVDITTLDTATLRKVHEAMIVLSGLKARAAEPPKPPPPESLDEFRDPESADPTQAHPQGSDRQAR